MITYMLIYATVYAAISVVILAQCMMFFDYVE